MAALSRTQWRRGVVVYDDDMHNAAGGGGGGVAALRLWLAYFQRMDCFTNQSSSSLEEVSMVFLLGSIPS